MALFKNARQVRPHTKILEIGGAKAGKTFDMFYFLREGKLGVFEIEDGAYPYSSRYDFELVQVRSIKHLLEMKSELMDPEPSEEILQFQTVGFDGVTRLWQDEVGSRADANKGQIRMDQQYDLKRPWMSLNSWIKQLGNLEKNVIATAHSKIDWEIRKGQQPKMRGIKGDFDQRLIEAFDLVVLRNREEIKDDEGKILETHFNALVMYSRYPDHLPMGTFIRDWDPALYIGPILDGTIRPIEGVMQQGPSDATREALKSLLERLGSEAKGGRIPNDLAKRAYKASQGQGSEDAALAMLADIKAIDAQPELAPAE